MANMTARIRMVDEMSDKLASLAEQGQAVILRFEDIGNTANESFGRVEGAATTAAQSVDGVAVSIDSMQAASTGASASADSLEAAFDRCDASAEALSRAIEASESAHDDLTSAVAATAEQISELSESESVSVETKERLQRAGEAAAEAMQNLERAQEAAAAAMQEHDDAMISGTEDLQELTDTAAGTSRAAQELTDAQQRAADSISELARMTEQAATGTDGYSDAAAEAGQQTDYWTKKIGNYDKSAMEAVYSTEQLVEAGYKTADALREQNDMLALCERQQSFLTKAQQASVNIQSGLSGAIEKASKAMSELSDNEKVSADTKDELTKASQQAEQAIKELEDAQREAETAMSNYDAVISSGTRDLNELEAAAEQACHAAENLAEANGRASSSSEALSAATEKASEEMAHVGEESEQSGEKGIEAIESIAGTLAAAGITAKVTEIANAVYELADSFSEAEKTVAAATGATGEELDNLMASSLDVYASSSADNLNDVAVAMTAVRNATGLTGDALEETTNSAIALENALDLGVSESTRTAAALMKNFSIDAQEAYDIIAAGAQRGANQNGDMLDVLNEYSAQYAALGLSADEFISSLVNGAEAGVFSVDKVGDAVKEFNIRAKDGSDTTAEAFEALGMNADEMSRRFAAGGDTARTAFFEVVDALNSMSDPMEKNIAAVNLFGTQYEDLGADILPVLASIEGGTVDVNGALSNMAEGAQSLGDQWQEAGNSISAAFTEAVEPSVSGVSSALADATQEAGDFLSEHQTLTRVITAVGTGLGVATVGLVGFSVATSSAAKAVISFATALNTALGPAGWVAIGVTALTTAVAAYAVMSASANDETAGMTATTREQYYELQDLNAEYERACEESGAMSEEALELRYQVDSLSESFEANRQTVEEFVSEVDALCESTAQVTDDFENAVSEIESTETGTMALIQKYEELATQAEITGAQQKELDAITKKLSETYPDLTEQLQNATLSVDEYVDAMRRMSQQQADEQKQQQAQETYVEALQKRAELAEELEKAQANYNAELEAHNMVWDEGMGKYYNGSYTADSVWASWTTDLDDYADALEKLEAANAENEATIAEIEQQWEDLATAESEAAEQTVSYSEAAATAYQSVQSKIEELCTAYDEAYQAAIESFEGQFSLFDEAEASAEATVANAQAALDSQLSYWEQYNANLETLTSYGADLTGEARENYEALLAYAQSGSEEAAGLAASMAAAIESGNDEAVSKLSETMGQVTAEQEEVAAATADWQTGFSEQMEGFEQDMLEIVDNMNIADDAEEKAREAVTAYADQIRAGKNGAVAAAKEVANAVTAALSATNATVTTSVGRTESVPGHARGTTNAEDVFIAGEDGPELIIDKGGSTVFPTEETDRIIDAVSAYGRIQELPAPAELELFAAQPDVRDEEEGFLQSISRRISALSEAFMLDTENDKGNAFTGPENRPDSVEITNVYTAGRSEEPVSINFDYPSGETDRIIEAITGQEWGQEMLSEQSSENAGGIAGYLSRLLSGISGTITATAGSITESISDALERRIGEVRRIDAYAGGTTDSSDAFIAGEDGPEIVLGQQGSTVFPTEETDRIISSLNERKPLQTEGLEGGKEAPGTGSTIREQVKRIILEVEGSGEIEVGGGSSIDRNAVLEILQDNLRPVLMSIIQQEIYEEGDLSYEF